MSAAALATVTASTKRPPAAAGGKVGAPATHLASLAVTPFQPLNPELVLDAVINDAREARRCYAFANSAGALPDVREGDILTVAGTDYAVRSVAEYNRAADGYVRLIVEETKLA